MGRPRSTAEIAADRRRTADLYLQGWLQADIAEEIGVNQSTVSRDLKALHKEWLKAALLDFNEAKAKELAKVDRLEREYWQAWRRSCEDAETLRQEGGTAGVDKIVKTAKGQAGDPRFLSGIQWCIEKRCKILGIDAPTRLDVYDWRKEAQGKGFDPATIFERFVQEAHAALVAGGDGAIGAGGVGGSKTKNRAGEK